MVTVTFPVATGLSLPSELTERTELLLVVYTKFKPEVAYEPSSTNGESSVDINGVLSPLSTGILAVTKVILCVPPN